jgi:hypothetical protein
MVAAKNVTAVIRKIFLYVIRNAPDVMPNNARNPRINGLQQSPSIPKVPRTAEILPNTRRIFSLSPSKYDESFALIFFYSMLSYLKIATFVRFAPFLTFLSPYPIFVFQSTFLANPKVFNFSHHPQLHPSLQVIQTHIAPFLDFSQISWQARTLLSHHLSPMQIPQSTSI